MRTLKYQARFIELADTINSDMPEFTVGLVQEALNGVKKSVNGAKILVSGIAYKRDVADWRESPAFDVITGLQRLGAVVHYVDPHVKEVDDHGVNMRSVPTDVSYAEYDAVVVVTDHRATDYGRMLREAKLIVDTRDALRNVEGDKSKVVRL
jgi:UDP-N-acetyl-D-glucosamine dehydrogenase